MSLEVPLEMTAAATELSVSFSLSSCLTDALAPFALEATPLVDLVALIVMFDGPTSFTGFPPFFFGLPTGFLTVVMVSSAAGSAAALGLFGLPRPRFGAAVSGAGFAVVGGLPRPRFGVAVASGSDFAVVDGLRLPNSFDAH
jgi:hypothetical protein